MLTLIAALMISGCVQKETSKQESYCGDGICDPAQEGCDCTDCINTPLCQQQETTPTEEKYVCGNGKCEPGEWCNTETLVTPCPEDCPRCPSHIFVEPFRCMPSDKCQKISNTFYVKDGAKIYAKLYNLGEISTTTIEAHYRCYDAKTRERAFIDTIVKPYKGAKIVELGFDNNDDEIKLYAKGVKGDDTAYTWKFELPELEEEYEISCKVEFRTKSPIDKPELEFNVKFLKS